MLYFQIHSNANENLYHKTKGKGFFKAIVMWLLGTRNWELVNDFTYELNGKNM